MFRLVWIEILVTKEMVYIISHFIYNGSI